MKKSLSTQKEAWLWSLSLILIALISIQSFDKTLTLIRGSDSPAYVLLAKSIATGQGYSDINIPGAPPHTQYPPLFPFLLSIPFYLFGFNFLWMKLLIISAAVTSVYMTKLVFRNEEDGTSGILLALAVAVNFNFVFFAKEILTEMPYMLLSLSAVYLAERYRASDNIRYAILVPLAISAAYLTRMIGITLYAAAAAALLLDTVKYRDKKGIYLKKLFFVGFAAILPFVLWSLRNSLLSEGAAYNSIFMQADYYAEDKGLLTFGALSARIFENLGYYREALTLVFLGSQEVKSFLPSIFLIILQLTVVPILLTGILYEAYTRRGVREFYFLAYMALLFAWPVYGLGDAIRYFIPMIPFLYFYFISGITRLASFGAGDKTIGTGAKKIAHFALILFLAINIFTIRETLWPPALIKNISNSIGQFQDLGQKIENPAPELFAMDYFEANSPCYSHYLSRAFSLKGKLTTGNVVLTRKPEVISLITGNPAVKFPFTNDNEKIKTLMENYHVDYVLLDSCYPEAKEFMMPYVSQNQNQFEVIPTDFRDTLLLKIKK